MACANHLTVMTAAFDPAREHRASCRKRLAPALFRVPGGAAVAAIAQHAIVRRQSWTGAA